MDCPLIHLGDIDTSLITDMDDMFYGAESFNQDISKWNIEKVEFIKRRFVKYRKFNQDLSDLKQKYKID